MNLNWNTGVKEDMLLIHQRLPLKGLGLPGTTMNRPPLYPVHDETDRLQRYAKLGLHVGNATVGNCGSPEDPLSQLFAEFCQATAQPDSDSLKRNFQAAFLVPASGSPLICLHNSSADTLALDFGNDLIINGDNSPDGAFTLHCPQFHVGSSSSGTEDRGWAIAIPLNKTLSISYCDPRPIAKVEAIINNFAFEYGNFPCNHRTSRGKVLRVEASGRVVDFAWRENYDQLRRLVEAKILPSTALTSLSFSVWEGATEDDLVAFAEDISSLCGIIVQQHTGIPVLSLLASDGKVVKRLVSDAVESKFRDGSILPCLHHKDGLPKLFRQCFQEHARMRQGALWSRMPFLCAAIEDPPYLEQKHATLMAAVELLIRNCLIEGSYMTQEEAEEKTLPTLIGLARNALRWDVPKHYTKGERHRELRNAVAHGTALPYAPLSVRHDFDKWRLFLLRRLLIRMGFDGKVASPQKGYASVSEVDEFSEEHNTFGS